VSLDTSDLNVDEILGLVKRNALLDWLLKRSGRPSAVPVSDLPVSDLPVSDLSRTYVVTSKLATSKRPLEASA